ncbi:YacP-like NYN domain protein [Stieleria maiorica]|uniref:YacP-like NYN domain protein n=1 Tax=Stieleria maiorica TaxID=2795974 RepID=A0A5B9MQ20_9BACT|nr:NYN domain-containing protein [Stieleria maiorica]QEG02107.1 YacP-like NYN domain protein [Stieleria maiorica]
MSLLLLIDGYNITQPIGPVRNADPRWLERDRNVLLRELTNHLSAPVRKKTCVVFDAANPPRDRPSEFVHQEMAIRFAVDYLSADDLLEEIIRAHHTPKRLMVVSSDHRIQIAARRRGAAHFDSQPWMDDLTDGKIHLAISPVSDSAVSDSARSGRDSGGAGQGGRSPAILGNPPRKDRGATNKPRVQDQAEVDAWMREFGFDPD